MTDSADRIIGAIFVGSVGEENIIQAWHLTPPPELRNSNCVKFSLDEKNQSVQN